MLFLSLQSLNIVTSILVIHSLASLLSFPSPLLSFLPRSTIVRERMRDTQREKERERERESEREIASEMFSMSHQSCSLRLNPCLMPGLPRRS